MEEQFDDNIKQLCDEIRVFAPLRFEQHDKRKVELQHVKDDDILFNQLSQMSIGKPYAFNEVMSIIEEGELRYRNLIPPGYMDAPKKAGTQKYGDLIIWKEILQQAQSVSKPVIYVCDDFKEIYVDDKKSGCYVRGQALIRVSQKIKGSSMSEAAARPLVACKARKPSAIT